MAGTRPKKVFRPYDTESKEEMNTPIRDKIIADFYSGYDTKSEWVLTEDELKALWNEYTWETEYIITGRRYMGYDEFVQKIKDKILTFFGKPIVIK